MYNYWLVQVRIREAVCFIEKLLNDEYQYTLSYPHEWRESLEELIETIYFNDIVVHAGLTRYRIVPELDKYGLVSRLTLLEK